MSATLTNKLNTINSIKANIKQAIEKKGVTVDGAFDTYPECINSIEAGGGDELAIGLIDGTISGYVEIPDGVTQIGQYAFIARNNITSVSIPRGVTSIGESAFAKCTGLSSVTIPDSVTSIGLYAFQRCSALTSVTIPSGVTSIEKYAFESCSGLKSVTIPDGLTSISDYAFGSCRGLTSVTISDSITSIGESAFTYCSSLTSITIPSSVTKIGYAAFKDCSALASVTIEHAEAKLQYIRNSFANIAKDAILYVPEALLSEYQADTDWSGAFAEIRAIASEPASYTITGVSVDREDPSANECAVDATQTETLSFTFFGTGLTDSLDYANIITVTSPEGYNIRYNTMNEAAQDGTWVTLDYNITSTSQDVSQWADEIQFACGEWTGTINCSRIKLRGARMPNVAEYNDYPHPIQCDVEYYIDSTNSDVYINDDAMEYIASCINIDNNVQSIICTSKSKEQYEDSETMQFVNYVQCRYEIQPANENDIHINVTSLDGNTIYIEHTIPAAVHIQKFEVNDVVAINGDERVHLTKNENGAFVIPQVGPTLLLPLSGLNEGVNVWDDTVTYTMSYDADGTDMGFFMKVDSLETWNIDGTQYWCVRIDTNSIDRGDLLEAMSYIEGTILPLKINVEIHGVSQTLDATLQQTDMALPSGCTQITDGISNKFSLNDIDTYRYINTDIVPTTNTIVKADLGLQATYGQCLIGYQTSDDFTDWRLFSAGNIESGGTWDIYFDYGGYYDDGNLMDVGNRIHASVEASAMVDENNNPKRLSFTISNGKLEVLDNNNTQLVSMTSGAWDGHNADQMQNICIWQQGAWDGSWDIDIATMYDVKIYDSQAGVDLNAPLMHVIPVTVNGETKVFDTVTRTYKYVDTFQLS